MRSIKRLNKYIWCSVIICLSLNARSQGGFLGRKNALGLSILGNIPLSSGAFFQPNYFQVSEKLRERKDWLDLGASMQYKRTIGTRTELGVDFILKSIQVDRDTMYQSFFKNDILVNYVRNTSVRSESVRILSYSILPTISISPHGSISNAGLSHEIGLGITYSKIREKNYYYSINEFGEDVTSWTAPDVYLLETNWPRFRGYSLKYGVQIELPIGYKFQLKIGTSAILTLYPTPIFSEVENNQVDFFNYSALFYNLQRENLFTLNLKSGIVYVF